MSLEPQAVRLDTSSVDYDVWECLGGIDQLEYLDIFRSNYMLGLVGEISGWLGMSSIQTGKTKLLVLRTASTAGHMGRALNWFKTAQMVEKAKFNFFFREHRITRSGPLGGNARLSVYRTPINASLPAPELNNFFKKKRGGMK